MSNGTQSLTSRYLSSLNRSQHQCVWDQSAISRWPSLNLQDFGRKHWWFPILNPGVESNGINLFQFELEWHISKSCGEMVIFNISNPWLSWSTITALISAENKSEMMNDMRSKYLYYINYLDWNIHLSTYQDSHVAIISLLCLNPGPQLTVLTM